jgi:hypothetical protein
MERDGRAILAVTHTSGATPPGDAGRALAAAEDAHSGRSWEPRIGAGHGLTIVRGIVEAHSGEIAVHDTIGGSRFELRLPMPAGQGRQAHAAAERSATPARLEPAGLAQPADQSELSDLYDHRAQSSRPLILLRRRRTP